MTSISDCYCRKSQISVLIILIAGLVCSKKADALEFKVVGPCDQKPQLEVYLNLKELPIRTEKKYVQQIVLNGLKEDARSNSSINLKNQIKEKVQSVLQNEDKKISLGDLTVKLLESHRIPFKGNAQGIAQINDSPMGQDAIEILNSVQMRAYGWCVHVDNLEPAAMPDQVLITEENQKITWFYAFSLYDNGEWKDYCTPSWKLRSISYCQSQNLNK